jgi:hypothetical protein
MTNDETNTRSIDDADTDPKRWLFAGQMFKPVAGAYRDDPT